MSDNVIPMTPERPAVAGGVPTSKQNVAVRVGLAMADRWRFVRSWKKFFQFTGNCWEERDESEVIAACIDTVRLIRGQVGDVDLPKPISKMLDADNYGPGDVTSTMTMARKELLMNHTEFNKKQRLLPVANGTVDLETGKLQQSRPEDLMIHSLSLNYDPAAECPRFIQFLHESLNSQEEVDFMARMFGFMLTGDTDPAHLFYLYGDGANGKSTLINVLEDLLGEFFTKGHRSLMMTGKEQHDTIKATLHSRRCVALPEVGSGARIKAETVKDLVSSDLISARRMKEDEWTFKPTHKFIMAGNHLAQISDADHGIWRRIVLINFDKIVPVEKRDPKLQQKLKAELPGILAWAVRGSVERIKNGLQIPDSMRQSTATYQDDSDWFSDCVADEFIVEPEAMADASMITARINEWCERHNQKKPTRQDIAQRLKRAGMVQKRTKNKRMWQGIRLPQSEDHGGPPLESFNP